MTAMAAPAADERRRRRGAQSGRWVRRGRQDRHPGRLRAPDGRPRRRVPRAGGARAAHPARSGPAVRRCTRRWSPAAAPSPAALSAVERFLIDGRRALGGGWRLPATGCTDRAPTAGGEQQRRFTADPAGVQRGARPSSTCSPRPSRQRSEHRTGVWLSGLDMLGRRRAAAARPRPRAAPGDLLSGARPRRGDPPGQDPAARRRREPGRADPGARGNGWSGHGIASSLVHEVGHQGAALLALVESLRPALLRRARGRPAARPPWRRWDRWISEIVADLWSVARLGIGSTLGLVGVVSLPRWFVFRPGGDDPHPVPWIRVQLSCAIGNALYPDPQWDELAALWTRLYPLEDAPAAMRRPLEPAEATIPAFVRFLLGHRPPALRGRPAGRRAAHAGPQPGRPAGPLRVLAGRPHPARRRPAGAGLRRRRTGPRGRLLSPESESTVLDELLTGWAVRSSLDTSLLCARASVARYRGHRHCGRSVTRREPVPDQPEVQAHRAADPAGAGRRDRAPGSPTRDTTRQPRAGPATGSPGTWSGRSPATRRSSRGRRASTWTRPGGRRARTPCTPCGPRSARSETPPTADQREPATPTTMPPRCRPRADRDAGRDGGRDRRARPGGTGSRSSPPAPGSDRDGRHETSTTPGRSWCRPPVRSARRASSRSACSAPGRGTSDQVLWTLIRNRTKAISFRRYREFIDGVMCRGVDVRNPLRTPTSVLNFTGTQAYEVLKQATDAFLMQECGVVDAAGAVRHPGGVPGPAADGARAERPGHRRHVPRRGAAPVRPAGHRSPWTRCATCGSATTRTWPGRTTSCCRT